MFNLIRAGNTFKVIFYASDAGWHQGTYKNAFTLKLLSITEFLGRLHPLLVHLPIGILLTALLLQWLALKAKYRVLQPAVPVILLAGIISAAASCITGYLLSASDEYEHDLVNWHMWMGISVLAVSILLYIKELHQEFPVSSKILSAGLLIVVTITGHLGGSLTHGAGYITTAFKDIFIEDSTANIVVKPLANVQEALVYDSVVKPILQTKCFSCHNAAKQKGGLRMDDIARLMKGGKEGRIVEPGNAAESEMVKRLLLPTDNDKHMPPKEKPQPTENQVALLQWWINNGANFSRKVKEFKQPANIKQVLAGLEQPLIVIKKEAADIPLTLVDKADQKTMDQLKEHGIIILPVAQNSNYLTASFVSDSIVDKTDLDLLQKLKKQLVWLKLENTNLNDALSGELEQLTNLTRLNISNTLITDKALQELASLKELQYLNLAGTNVTAAGLIQLKPLIKLKALYLYRTQIKSTDYLILKNTFPSVSIDTGGYRVPVLVSDTTKVTAGKK